MKQNDDEPIPYNLTKAARSCRKAGDASFCGKQSIDPRRRCGRSAGHEGACRFGLGIPAVQDATCGPDALRLPPATAAAGALGSRSPAVLPSTATEAENSQGYYEVKLAAAGTTDRLCPCGLGLDWQVDGKWQPLCYDCSHGEAPIQGASAIETSTRCVGSNYEAPAIAEVTCKTCKTLIRALAESIEGFNAYTRPQLADYAKLSHQDVIALRESIVVLGFRVRKAHDAFKKHADLCRKTGL